MLVNRCLVTLFLIKLFLAAARFLLNGLKGMDQNIRTVNFYSICNTNILIVNSWKKEFL